MDAVQKTTTAVSEAIRQRYFPTNDVAAWVGENT
jgi:hypothetical protein